MSTISRYDVLFSTAFAASTESNYRRIVCVRYSLSGEGTDTPFSPHQQMIIYATFPFRPRSRLEYASIVRTRR
ncbi:hypothetical protein AB0L53_34640 [Nonomuraea sp. NPDC052129]|uniref:hypothetical protein n=1 Tax=Nonomuraea sp. NPDC052129 TaxID=3154651 RepID=UPI00343C034A